MTCSHLTLLPPIRAPPSPVDACDPGLKTLRYNGLHSAIPPHPHEFDFDATLTHWLDTRRKALNNTTVGTGKGPAPGGAFVRVACHRSRSKRFLCLKIAVIRRYQVSGRCSPLWNSHALSRAGARMRVDRIPLAILEAGPAGPGLAHNPGRPLLSPELPCSAADSVWRGCDGELANVVAQALSVAGLSVPSPILAVASRKLAQANPTHARDYREHLERVDTWLGGINGVFTRGRQGLLAHGNTHHVLARAYALDRHLHDDGPLDRGRWEKCRHTFRAHVVED